MSKKFPIALIAVSCVMIILLFAACSPTKPSETSNSEPAVEYSDNSLIAYHKTMGEDISAFTEVSKENCANPDCHGDWAKIKADTEGVLKSGSLTADPHDNHQTTNIECSDCHSLAEPSTLYCKKCHTYEITRDNGTWAM